jgi:hypothetical protein
MSNPAHMSNSRPSRLVRTGLVVASVAAVIGLVAMTAVAILMVSSGRGLESYRTTWLVEFNWVGFLVFEAALVVALLAGLALRWRERRQWRELDRTSN